MHNPLNFIRSASIDGDAPFKSLRGVHPISTRSEVDTKGLVDLDRMPDGVVASNVMLDLSNVTDPDVRSSLSLSLLFASRYATNEAGQEDPDAWLSAYQTALVGLGFGTSNLASITHSFSKKGATVHENLIPFLTVAFGGASIGPIILAALEQLDDMDKDSPWITLFDREARRVDVHEMHFAAAYAGPTDTEIRYVVARLNVEQTVTQVLFFKVTDSSAKFTSQTMALRANNSLLAVYENELRSRLQHQVTTFLKSIG